MRSVPTCRVMPAARWASALPRSLCRGWSHTRRRCSPPWRSPARAACGAASLAKSAEGNFEPASTHREKSHEVTQGPPNRGLGLGQGHPNLVRLEDPPCPCVWPGSLGLLSPGRGLAPSALIHFVLTVVWCKEGKGYCFYYHLLS